MGMDQYVMCADRANFERKNQIAEYLAVMEAVHASKVQQKVMVLGKTVSELPEDQCVALANEYYGSEEYKSLRREFNHLESSESELRYWRKAYVLHDFIRNHLIGPDCEDNCVPIVLTPEFMRDLVEWLKSEIRKKSADTSEDEDDLYYYLDRMRQDVDFFSDLMTNTSAEKVIYYYAWY